MKIDIAATLLLAALPVAGMAQEAKVTAGRHAVAVARTELRADTPAMARRSLRLIEHAAMAVCGAPEGSLHELIRATRTSACWREAVSDAVRRLDAPLLSHAWRDTVAGTAR